MGLILKVTTTFPMKNGSGLITPSPLGCTLCPLQVFFHFRDLHVEIPTSNVEFFQGWSLVGVPSFPCWKSGETEIYVYLAPVNVLEILGGEVKEPSNKKALFLHSKQPGHLSHEKKTSYFPLKSWLVNDGILVEGSLNRNFRQYGQLKSRVE